MSNALGVEAYLGEIAEDLKAQRYRPSSVLRVEIPRPDGRRRPLGIPTVRDRVVQQACKIIIEPVFEASFHPCSYGYRPKRSAGQAVLAVKEALVWRWWALDAGIESFFDSVDHEVLMRLVRRRISDRRVLKMIDQWLRAGVVVDGRRQETPCGVPQGGVVSPLLANIYLHTLNRWWFVGVGCGGYHALGLKSDGSVVAWGRNWDGQCDVPAPNADFVAVAAGTVHSLGLKSDGKAAAWGRNQNGQCDVPVPNADFVAVAAGAYHTLAPITAIERPDTTAVSGAPALSVVSLSPNPFNPSVEVLFELRGSGQVTMEIYDVSGRCIRTTFLGVLGSGLHVAWWDGRDGRGAGVSSGVYFVRLCGAGGESRAVKAVLLR